MVFWFFYVPKALFSGMWFLEQQLRELIYFWNSADLCFDPQSRQPEQ
jgi:hypothetical protein